MSLKLEYCFFFDDEIDYLGYVMKLKKFAILEMAIDAIRGLKQPTNVTKMKSFLSLCIVYHRFVPNFARIAALSTKKLMNDQPFHFDGLDKTELQALSKC